MAATVEQPRKKSLRGFITSRSQNRLICRSVTTSHRVRRFLSFASIRRHNNDCRSDDNFTGRDTITLPDQLASSPESCRKTVGKNRFRTNSWPQHEVRHDKIAALLSRQFAATTVLSYRSPQRRRSRISHKPSGHTLRCRTTSEKRQTLQKCRGARWSSWYFPAATA